MKKGLFPPELLPELATVRTCMFPATSMSRAREGPDVTGATENSSSPEWGCWIAFQQALSAT